MGAVAIHWEKGWQALARTLRGLLFHEPKLDLTMRIRKIRPAVRNTRFIIQVSKGLIRSQQSRRMIMFYGVIIALVLLFAGATLLWNLLREHPLIFLAYWAACAWITLLAVLLAIYDILRVRADARQTLRRIQEEIISKEEDSHDADPR